MPQTQINTGINSGGTPFYAIFRYDDTAVKLRLTLNGEGVAGQTISFSVIDHSPGMVCSFGAMSHDSVSVTTDSDGYVALDGGSQYVRMYFSGGECTLSASSGKECVDTLTGVLTSIAPVNE